MKWPVEKVKQEVSILILKMQEADPTLSSAGLLNSSARTSLRGAFGNCPHTVGKEQVNCSKWALSEYSERCWVYLGTACAADAFVKIIKNSKFVEIIKIMILPMETELAASLAKKKK